MCEGCYVIKLFEEANLNARKNLHKQRVNNNDEGLIIEEYNPPLNK